MSHSYFTRKLLTIKDKNINFPEDYLEEVKINGLALSLKGLYLINRLIANTVGRYLIQRSKKTSLKRLEL